MPIFVFGFVVNPIFSNKIITFPFLHPVCLWVYYKSKGITFLLNCGIEKSFHIYRPENCESATLILKVCRIAQKRSGDFVQGDGGSEWKRYYWSGIQPLSHRWFLIKDIRALVCPFAVHRSRFGLRYSRVRGRRQSKFLASSSTGGARNFYPYTGEPRTFAKAAVLTCTGEPRNALRRRCAPYL